ncbi:MAG: hypothetical protein IJD92_04885 [Bacilli bacterium]|nr:hypothetical protein [Bacilli bacterium]
MIKLKNKIKIIKPLPDENNKKDILNIIIINMIILLFLIIIIFTYINMLPYINAIDINKITGKKTTITNCNTKDYIIIEKDKTYNMSITNEECNQEYYEGTLIIKNNTINFNNNIKGTIDNKYNIIINNNIFESDNNE